eukprot:324625-Ditylum_brightwellii.AAC.1
MDCCQGHNIQEAFKTMLITLVAIINALCCVKQFKGNTVKPSGYGIKPYSGEGTTNSSELGYLPKMTTDDDAYNFYFMQSNGASHCNIIVADIASCAIQRHVHNTARNSFTTLGTKISLYRLSF